MSKFRAVSAAVARFGGGYATRPGNHSRGPALREARVAAGFDIGQAARILSIPVQALVKVEAGLLTFTREGAFEDAARYYRTHKLTEAARAEFRQMPR
jgi:hypothetical protein